MKLEIEQTNYVFRSKFLIILRNIIVLRYLFLIENSKNPYRLTNKFDLKNYKNLPKLILTYVIKIRFLINRFIKFSSYLNLNSLHKYTIQIKRRKAFIY